MGGIITYLNAAGHDPEEGNDRWGRFAGALGFDLGKMRWDGGGGGTCRGIGCRRAHATS